MGSRSPTPPMKPIAHSPILQAPRRLREWWSSRGKAMAVRIRHRVPSRRFVARTLSVFLPLYVGSYVARGLKGTYGRGAVGAGRIKSGRWYPKGFGFRNNLPGLELFYMPLYRLDLEYWHDESYPPSADVAFVDDYP